MHLESPWISGFRFKRLESIWNWFSFLNVLDFFIEQNRKTSTLRSFKVNKNKCPGIKRIKFSKFSQNVWKHSFFSHCSFITFTHVHWATNAQWMSGLHVFSRSPCIVWLFCMWRCWYPKHSFQHKHFAWLEVNSYIPVLK